MIIKVRNEFGNVEYQSVVDHFYAKIAVSKST